MQLLNKHDSKILVNKHVQKLREFEISILRANVIFEREIFILDQCASAKQNILQNCLSAKLAIASAKLAIDTTSHWKNVLLVSCSAWPDFHWPV